MCRCVKKRKCTLQAKTRLTKNFYTRMLKSVDKYAVLYMY